MASKARKQSLGQSVQALELLEPARLQVDKADMIAIVISDAELQLTSQRDQHKAEGEQQQQLAKAIYKELGDTLRERARALVDVEPLLQVLSTYDEQVTVQIYQLSAQLQINEEPVLVGTATVQIRVQRVDGTRDVYLNRVYDGKEELRARWQQAQDLERAAQDNFQIALDNARKLSQIGMLERMVRARLARASLQQQEGGQELLQLLTGELQRDLLQLG